MLCTTAINTSNTIRTQTGSTERYSSGLDTNSCYYVITTAFNYRSLLWYPTLKSYRHALQCFSVRWPPVKIAASRGKGDMDPHLLHSSSEPTQLCHQTGARSVHPFLHGSTVWTTHIDVYQEAKITRFGRKWIWRSLSWLNEILATR